MNSAKAAGDNPNHLTSKSADRLLRYE